MQLRYGGVNLGIANGARYTWGRDLLRNRAGIGVGFTYRAGFSEILFTASSQSNCSAQMSAVETVLRRQAADLEILMDNGNPSANSIQSSATFSGVRCISGPNWSDRPGSQMLNWREFSAVFEWETALPEAMGLLMDFKETLVMGGGTPLTVVLEPLNASPVAQVTIPEQKYTASQRGTAVGFRMMPDVNLVAPPIFSASPNQKVITKDSADRVGDNYKNYRLSWMYAWESATALVGNPHQWTG